MHKKLESELISLAHSILQMKNKSDVIALKNKAKEVYEKLAVLEFVDRYVATTPTNTKSSEEIVEVLFKENAILVEEEIIDISTDILIEKTEAVEEIEVPILFEEPLIDLSTEVLKEVVAISEENEIVAEEILQKDETNLFSDFEKSNKPKKMSLEEELQDTIPVDVATDIFEKAVRVDVSKRSLNDSLNGSLLQIGLNDRIAFVKHLFENSQEDFNRVISQINTFKSETECLNFVQNRVKPDYTWSGKEAYEERFITLITRKFS